MKILSINGTLSVDAANPLDMPKSAMPPKQAKLGEVVRADGIHYFMVGTDGSTEHVLVPFSEIRALLQSKCPNFVPPPPLSKPVANPQNNAKDKAV